MAAAAFVIANAATGPLETVKADINQVLSVVGDKSLSRDAKVKKIEVLYQRMVDEVSFPRGPWAATGTSFSPDQQKQFVPLFRKILEKSYVDKILAYNNEKIVFSKETMISNTQAEVLTKVVATSRETPILYRLIQKDGAWKVYDFIIETVRFVQNYRSQFDDIYKKHPGATYRYSEQEGGGETIVNGRAEKL